MLYSTNGNSLRNRNTANVLRKLSIPAWIRLRRPGTDRTRDTAALFAHRRAGVEIKTISFLVVITALTVSLEVWSRLLASENELLQSRRAVENIAQAAEEHVEGTFNTVSWLLDGIVERIEADGLADSSARKLRTYMTSRLQRQGSPLQGVFVVGSDGSWLVSTADSLPGPANSADRAYFVHHRAVDSPAVRVGAPVVSRSSGDWIVTLSRRFNRPDGAFGGVVLATIPVSYFQRYYERFDVGAKGVVLLAMRDGTVIMRHPTANHGTGSSMRGTPLYRHMQTHGLRDTVMLMTAFDRTERLVSYRLLENYPLLVSAGLAKNEVLQHWAAVTWYEAGAIVFMLIVNYIGGGWVIVQARHRARLEAELEGRNAVLDKMANTDSLTGLANRRHLDELLTTELARAARDNNNVAFILLDVDFFKRYNDHYGHAAGDDCLKAVARAIAAAVRRPSDVAARFGGEEFAVLLPGTELAGATLVAESIREHLAAAALPHPEHPLGIVTISAGVAMVRPRPGADSRLLIEEADAALYEAKRAGRNRVIQRSAVL